MFLSHSKTDHDADEALKNSILYDLCTPIPRIYNSVDAILDNDNIQTHQQRILVGSYNDRTSFSRQYSKNFQAFEFDYNVIIDSLNETECKTVIVPRLDKIDYVWLKHYHRKRSEGVTEDYEYIEVDGEKYLNGYAIKEKYDLQFWNNCKCINIKRSVQQTSIAFKIVPLILEHNDNSKTLKAKLDKFQILSYKLDSWIIEEGREWCMKQWTEITIDFIVGIDICFRYRKYSLYKTLFSHEYQRKLQDVKNLLEWVKKEDFKSMLNKYKTYINVYEYLTNILKTNPFFNENGQTDILKYYTRALITQLDIYQTHVVFKSSMDHTKAGNERIFDLTPVVHLKNYWPSMCTDVLRAISGRYGPHVQMAIEQIGCDLVPKWSRQGHFEVDGRLDFRYAFSRVEGCLANVRNELEISFMGFVKCLFYHYIADSMMIDSYTFKTLLNWYIEKSPIESWKQTANFLHDCYRLVNEHYEQFLLFAITSFEQKKCDHYWLRNQNINLLEVISSATQSNCLNTLQKMKADKWLYICNCNQVIFANWIQYSKNACYLNHLNLFDIFIYIFGHHEYLERYDYQAEYLNVTCSLFAHLSAVGCEYIPWSKWMDFFFSVSSQSSNDYKNYYLTGQFKHDYFKFNSLALTLIPNTAISDLKKIICYLITEWLSQTNAFIYHFLLNSRIKRMMKTETTASRYNLDKLLAEQEYS
ncbi:unnamed protein product [Didymodactylos carnosus]|nr:unnamed protein product [Didymodactylos carnosus]CAF3800097.1 unnamed protein product [Didymodactylos carnosus]